MSSLPAESSDPRVLRTRRLLEDALLSFAQEKPYTAVTVKDIAARATVNRATFYAHFTDKDDLLRCVLRNQLDRALSVRLGTGEESAEPVTFEAYLDALLPAALEYSDAASGGCRNAGRGGLDAGIPEAELQARVETLVGRWLSPDADPDCSTGLAARAVGAMVARVSTDWSRRAERPPSEEVIGRLRALILGAVEALAENTLAEQPDLSLG